MGGLDLFNKETIRKNLIENAKLQNIPIQEEIKKAKNDIYMHLDKAKRVVEHLEDRLKKTEEIEKEISLK